MMPLLLADAGATKTAWSLLNVQGSVHTFTTAGINPSFTKDEEIHNILVEVKTQLSCYASPEYIHFYGAGCAAEDRKNRVSSALLTAYPKASITVFTDLEGAAKALFKKQSGCAIILGTGANSGYYNGQTIIHSQNHLGFLLGDEGSGSHLGKQWLTALMQEETPTDLSEIFYRTYHTHKHKLLNQLYQHSSPNSYLAMFVPFLAGHQSHEFIKRMVQSSFRTLCERYLLQYPQNERQIIRCTGGVAMAFQSILQDTFKDYGMQVDKIVEAPLSELITHYTTEDIKAHTTR